MRPALQRTLGCGGRDFPWGVRTLFHRGVFRSRNSPRRSRHSRGRMRTGTSPPRGSTSLGKPIIEVGDVLAVAGGDPVGSRFRCLNGMCRHRKERADVRSSASSRRRRVEAVMFTPYLDPGGSTGIQLAGWNTPVADVQQGALRLHEWRSCAASR
jgi:hypothetical protein